MTQIVDIQEKTFFRIFFVIAIEINVTITGRENDILVKLWGFVVQFGVVLDFFYVGLRKLFLRIFVCFRMDAQNIFISKN